LHLFIYHIQALLLILSSATAVTIFGMRLSDVAIIFFTVSLVISKPTKKASIVALSLLLIILSFTIFVSTFFAAIVDYNKLQDGISNAVAVPLGIGLSLLCVWLLNPNQVITIMSTYSKFIVLISLFLLIWYIYFGQPSFIVYAENFDRFSGLSQNPNQLALYLLPVPFFSVIAYVFGKKNRWSLMAEITLIVIINALVLGKALFIGWGLSLIFIFIIGNVWFGNIQVFKVKFLLRIFFSVTALIASVPVFFLLYSGAIAGSQEDQGSIRIQLWENGIKAWTDSFFLGHGPGHYSGLDYPYEGMESHNLLIDWLSSYGLFGSSVLIALFVWLFIYFYKQRAWIIIALLITIMIQSTFHFYGRQPLFWLLLVFAYLTVAEYSKRTRIYK